jgi:hypothetical protein
MYLVNFELLKSLELTNYHLKIENLEKKTLISRPPYDATIDINKFFVSLDDPINRCFQCFVSNSIENLILTIKFKKSKIN